MASSTSSCSPPEGRRYKSRTTSARRNPIKEGSKGRKDPGAPPKFLDLVTELYADCKEEKGKLVSTGGNRDCTSSFNIEDSTSHVSHDAQIGSSGVGRIGKRFVREHVVESPAKKRSSGLVASFKQLEQSIKSKLEEEDLRVAQEARDCLKVVKADGICEGDDLYNKAIYLFKNPVYRAAFMGMKTLAGRLSFLRYLTRMSSSEDSYSTTDAALHERRNWLEVMALLAQMGALVASMEASSSEEDPSALPSRRGQGPTMAGNLAG